MQCQLSISVLLFQVSYILAKHCYLFYDVNPGEGFNLRRDVYLRVAALNNILNCTLVLPPWDHLYHWQSNSLNFQGKLPWSKFFDLKQLGRYTKLVEFESFVQEETKSSEGLLIDVILHLQHPTDLNGSFEEKANFVKCKKLKKYWKEDDATYGGPFWSYENVFAKKLKCLEILGGPRVLKPVLQNLIESKSNRLIFLDRAETLLHDQFGQTDYWRGRRSMRFSTHLIDIANEFRKTFLKSSDEEDGTKLPLDWRVESKLDTYSRGGPYIAAHLRRKDFLSARKSQIPSLEKTAETLSLLAKKNNVSQVFIASDASDIEIEEIMGHIPEDLEIFTFRPSLPTKGKILDGGVAIVDQIICACAKYFIGSYESTFSFRIQEEREIRQLHPDSTFNRFCGDQELNCQQPTRWKIVF
ncbi:GDP-fucose protein O-fucosyltransferase 2-like isoform X2 [Artemia franciscana]|uniref:GDP-fucose protein O-fucosyltransferase 2 n=1 Tax=Artemia franciscana TaxID=6661 RepID=A0AA88HZY0_ARTSF|nr:hypothetical protein QYM36_009678 [Artemia franciscana]